jgi:FkbM family methyltransferase
MSKELPTGRLRLVRVRRAAVRLVPARWRLPVGYRLLSLTGLWEPELERLRELVPPGLAIDVGANHGIYSYALARLGHRVEAFEPQPSCAATLRSWACGRVNLHEIALSDVEGTLPLYIPMIRGVPLSGYATLDDPADGCEMLEVPVRRLDDFGFSDVSFIKVDVEGHEARVLRGASETIQRWGPVLMIEISLLHLAEQEIHDLFAQVESYGYQGRFFDHRQLRPLSAFSIERHQRARLDGDRSAPFVFNFIFQPVGHRRLARNLGAEFA